MSAPFSVREFVGLCSLLAVLAARLFGRGACVGLAEPKGRECPAPSVLIQQPCCLLSQRRVLPVRERFCSSSFSAVCRPVVVLSLPVSAFVGLLYSGHEQTSTAACPPLVGCSPSRSPAPSVLASSCACSWPCVAFLVPVRASVQQQFGEQPLLCCVWIFLACF